MARKQEKTEQKYFQKIKKINEVDYVKHKKQIAEILKNKQEWLTARDMRKQKHKEYKMWQVKERKALKKTLEAIPNVVED